MIEMPQTISDLSNDFAYLIFETAWKSTIILGSVVIFSKFLKRRSASLRRSVFSAAILTMLFFTVSAPFFPRQAISLPIWVPTEVSYVKFSRSRAVTTTSDPTSAQSVEIISGYDTGLAIDRQFPTNLENKETNADFTALLENLTVFIWLAGAIFLFWRLGINLCGLRYLRRTSRIPADTDLNFLLRDITRRFGCRSPRVTILENEMIAMPFTWGIFRHTILMPKDFENLSDRSRRIILAHELAHVERYDFIVRSLANVLCAMLWFQPLAWLVRRKLRMEQERAADDRVLATGEKASTYAKLLLGWHERLAASRQLPRQPE